MARTPVLPEAAPVGALSAEVVRKRPYKFGVEFLENT
jgi:hypothetical protein